MDEVIGYFKYTNKWFEELKNEDKMDWGEVDLIHGNYLWVCGINVLKADLIDTDETVVLKYKRSMLGIDLSEEAHIYCLVVKKGQSILDKFIGAELYIAIADATGSWAGHKLVSIDNNSLKKL